MEYYFQNKKVTSISNLKSQWFLEVNKLIPQNTTIITKEMIKQFDAEQTVIQKELENYNSWLHTTQVLIIEASNKLKLIKKWFKFSQVLSSTSLFQSL